MRLDILSGILQTAGLGTIGGPDPSIFISEMDADCIEGILIRLPVDGVPVDLNLPNYYKHYVQVIVRSADQLTGTTRIAAAVAALTMLQITIFTNADTTFAMQVNRLSPKTLPRDYPRLDGQTKEWAVDMDAVYVMPPS